MMEYALQLKNINKTFEDFKMNNICLNVPQGYVVGLIGENGAGKSTLIHMIEGIKKQDSGEILVFNQNMRQHEKVLKQDMGVIFDNCHYQSDFKCTDVAKMMSLVYENWDNQLFEQYIERFSLPKNKKVSEYSKGMKMKLAFATELSHHPRLLILDEATSGLDPVVRDEILDILREFVTDENHTVLMSSHITSDLDKLADFIIFLHEGKIIMNCTYEELHEKYGIVHCGKNVFEAMSEDDVIAYKKEDYEYRVLVKNYHHFKNIEDIVIEKATVEDVMVLCVRGEKIHESIDL